MKFAKGHAIWLYEPNSDLAKSIKGYNERSSIELNYLFVFGGSIESGIHFQDDCLDFYFDKDPNFRLYLIIDGSNRNLDALPKKTELRLVREIVTKVNQDHRISGLHINIEPFKNSSMWFYALVKEAIHKPLSISLYDWNHDILELCDLPVLMGYDLASVPETYSTLLRAKSQSFVNDVVSRRRHFMIGLPFIATHTEFEYRIHKISKIRESRGFTIDQYLSKGLGAIENLKNNELFVGVSVWAGLNRPVGTPSEAYQWFPFEINENHWNLLEKWSISED